MIIHGKELETTNDGEGIYYGNRLIRSKSQKINEHTDFAFWVEYITARPNFCACKASGLHERNPRLVCGNVCPNESK